MKKTAIYARVSTVDQETANQTDQLKKFAAAQQWEIIQVLTDQTSGSKGINERKGLEQLFTLAHRRQIDIVLVWSLDRLSREGSRKTIEYLFRLENYGCDFHSFTEPFLSSLGPFKDAIIAVLGALAKQERVRISERTKAGMERFKKLHPERIIGRPRIPTEIIKEVVELKESGLSLTEIGQRMGGLSAARICQLLKQGRSNTSANNV
jgi:DNA invertase Pin-like site-specific DNA recombinase